MKKLMLLLSAGIVLTQWSCSKDDDNTGNLSDQDRDFLQKIAYSNMAEVDAGTMAAAKGNASTRWYGDMMALDHNAAYKELKSMADWWKISIPAVADAEHKAMNDHLSSLSGNAFDSTYMRMQVKDHNDVINMMLMEIRYGNHNTVIDYAKKYLPAVQRHYRNADSLSRQML